MGVLESCRLSVCSRFKGGDLRAITTYQISEVAEINRKGAIERGTHGSRDVVMYALREMEDVVRNKERTLRLNETATLFGNHSMSNSRRYVGDDIGRGI